MPEIQNLSYIRAVNEALRWGLTQYPEMLFYGEDVAIPGGPYGASKGLLQEFGARVFDTPISESAMLGAALGAAQGGMRPVVEVMYSDFLMVAMDPIVNQIANARYVSDGRLGAPLVIRTQGGYTPGSCAQHSHSLEAMFAHIPGLRVAVPGTPNDAYQVLRSAIASDDPVLVIESRRLYATKGEVELDAPVEPIGSARIVIPGGSVTLVSWGTMLQPTIDAARALAASGVSAEVIDLRWASPIDDRTLVESVRRTRALVVAHEAALTGGLAGEIVARVTEQLPGVRVARLGSLDTPMPASPALSEAVVPNTQRIVDRVRQLLGAATN